jgi:hypothetical protein
MSVEENDTTIIYLRAYFEYLCDLFWEENKNLDKYKGILTLSELFELRRDSDEEMAKKLFVKNMEEVAFLLESAGKDFVAKNVSFYSFHINNLNTYISV